MLSIIRRYSSIRVIMDRLPPLLILDFDHTLVNHNTDTEIQKLSPGGKVPEEINALRGPNGWTEFMGAVFEHLHKSKVTKSQILECIGALTLVPGLEYALKRIHERSEAEIIIISDANSVFIEHILKTTKLDGLISRVYTNPAEFDDAELLKIRPFHHQTDCELSSKNLCKGRVMEDHISQSRTGYSFVAYVGDGSNDFCPMLRLGENDLAFPRKGYSIETYISKMKSEKNLEFKARTIYWADGSQILEVFEKKLQEVHSK